MGRAAAFTREEIFQAADLIRAGGNAVTPNAIREALGRGSYTTIVRTLREWEESQAAPPPLPLIEMPETAKAAFAQCWAALNIEAAKVIEQAHAEAAAAIDPLRLQYEDALTAIDKMESEQAADASRISNLESALDIARQSESESHSRTMVLTAVVDQMQLRIDEQQNEIERLRAAVATAQQSLLDKTIQLGRAEGEILILSQSFGNKLPLTP